MLVQDVERATGTGPKKNIARDMAADAVLVLLREEEDTTWYGGCHPKSAAVSITRFFCFFPRRSNMTWQCWTIWSLQMNIFSKRKQGISTTGQFVFGPVLSIYPRQYDRSAQNCWGLISPDSRSQNHGSHSGFLTFFNRPLRISYLQSGHWLKLILFQP